MKCCVAQVKARFTFLFVLCILSLSLAIVNNSDVYGGLYIDTCYLASYEAATV